MAEKEYIEREAVLEQIRVIYCGECNSYNGVLCRACEFDDAMSLLEDAPIADVVEVVHARWNEDKYPFCNVCPECGLIIDRTCIKYNSGKLNYCPNCGARMDGKKCVPRTEATP